MMLFAALLAPCLAAEPVVIPLGGSPPPAPAALEVPAAAPISIDVQDADIHHVLRLISDVSGLNFVVSDGVEARVTARLVDVPWDEALAAILAAEGLGATPVMGSIVQIRPL